jgi:pyruvate dehydrogenase E1 component beta subunit
MSTERKVTFIESLDEALREEMERDETVFYIGEDIDGKLLRIFGEKRVKRTPISENSFTGLAVGAAMTGLRPVVEIMYMDFILLPTDQIVNHAAKINFMSGGQLKVPLVIKAQFGVGTREAAQHSQSFEAWFVHVPGLKVVMPSTPYDAKGLLKTAIRGDSPVIFLQHRLLYGLEATIPDHEFLIPFGEADIKREGDDATIVATGFAVHKALQAAELLSGEISVEVIDPRTLVPLDIERIVESVKKTRRLLIVHESCTRGGVGAEIVRRVVERAFDNLRKPPIVLGGVNSPVPYSPPLEDAWIPQIQDIVAALRELV